MEPLGSDLTFLLPPKCFTLTQWEAEVRPESPSGEAREALQAGVQDGGEKVKLALACYQAQSVLQATAPTLTPSPFLRIKLQVRTVEAQRNLPTAAFKGPLHLDRSCRPAGPS